MADILRITTPLITKNPAQLQRQPDTGDVFPLQDLTKVIKSNPQSELLQQNNGFIEAGENSSRMIDLLKDPAAVVGFLRNIVLLQEIAGLLPLNSQTVTPEIRQMFEALFVSPEEIVPELIRQENATTIFKGAFFDAIRTALAENPGPDFADAALQLLKAVNSALDNRDALDSVANSLRYLSDRLSSSTSLSQKLAELSQSFRRQDAADLLPTLKAKLLPLFREIENSVLFSPKLAKLLPLITYNLSRFNNNPEALSNAADKYMASLQNPESKLQFVELLKSVLSRSQSKASPAAANLSDFSWGTSTGRAESGWQYSKVLNILTKIIGSQNDEDSLSPAARTRLEKVIYSMLSSPSNFTPLLHFILPVQHQGMQSFAEIWINPNETEEQAAENAGHSGGLHCLVAFDIPDIGLFEADLYLNGKTINFSLYCPPEHLSSFTGLEHGFRQAIRSLGFRVEALQIEKLNKQRSLLEVFATLPYRRMGIDIRV